MSLRSGAVSTVETSTLGTCAKKSLSKSVRRQQENEGVGGWQAGTAVGAAGGDVSPTGRQRFQRLCCCRSLPHFAGQSPSFCLFCHRTPCQISSLLTISWSISQQVFVRRSIQSYGFLYGGPRPHRISNDCRVGLWHTGFEICILYSSDQTALHFWNCLPKLVSFFLTPLLTSPPPIWLYVNV